jgi:putative ABC transport system permease protein
MKHATGTGGAVTIILRRMLRDRGIIAVWMLMVAFAAFLSVAAPAFVSEVADRGATAALRAAGPSSDVVESAAVGSSQDSDPDHPAVTPDAFLRAAAKLRDRLPSDIRSLYANQTSTVISASQPVVGIDGQPAAADAIFQAQVAMLTPTNAKQVHLVRGSMPASNRSGQVVLSDAAARAAGLEVGSSFDLAGPASFDGPDQPIRFRVVGIVAKSAARNSGPYAGASIWQDTPDLWAPRVPTAATPDAAVAITALAQPVTIESAAADDVEFVGHVRVRLAPAGFSAALESQVSHEIAALTTHPISLGATGSHVTVSSGFGGALSGFAGQARAALSQLSIMIAGVLAISLIVLILISRLIADRRGSEIALERARGASTISVAARSLGESLATTIIASAVGLVVAFATARSLPNQLILLLVVVLVAALASPIQTGFAAARMWAGRREAANRQDRLDDRKRRRGIRIAAELTFLVIAAGAVWSLTSRGLLQTSTLGIDPLLAITPVLFAAAITLVVARIYPFVVRAIGRVSRRSRGVLGLLGAVRAERSVSFLPLLALTLAAAITLSGSIFADTVSTGQVAASWQRVGADVRVNARVPSSAVDRIAGMPGVTAAASALVAPQVQLKLGSTTAFATMLAVDGRYPSLVSRLSPGSGTVLTKLTSGGEAEALPVVVDSTLADQLVTTNLGVYYGLKLVPLKVVGTTDAVPSGYLGGPFFYVDLSALSSAMRKTEVARELLVLGPGAARAVSTLRLPSSDIHTRSEWLARQRSYPLVSGVDTVIGLSALIAGLLAIVALIALVVTGARERGRWLSLLRTLGLRSRVGWWLALAELAPVVIAALIAGAIAASAMVLLFEPSLGFDLLTGGIGVPPPTVSVGDIAQTVVAAVLLLVIAVLVESALYRRDGLSRVLRVGETV